MAAIFELEPPAIRHPVPSQHRRPRGAPRGQEESRPTATTEREASRIPARTALLAVALLVGAVLLSRSVTSIPGSTSDSPTVPSGQLVVVGPGDTLWSIAEEHFPASQLVVAVEGLTALNGGSEALRVGDVVALPELG